MLRQSSVAKLIEKFPIDHVWVFLTDRCNLACSHCFFKHKTGRAVMTLQNLQSLLAVLPSNRRHQFILSGGEPLLEWKVLQSFIKEIQGYRADSYISVQSNMLLLTNLKINFLRDRHVNLEVGMDGDVDTTLLNRSSNGKSYHKELCQSIRAWQKAQGSLSVTMTVRPDGVESLFDNLLYLDSLGLSAIEIHPAFLEKWDDMTADLFIKGYKQACAYELRNKKLGLIGKEYSQPAKGVWDMLVMPNGKVIPNWVWLSFPEYVRAEAGVLDFADGHAKVHTSAGDYFSQLAFFLRKGGGKVSYRQLSNFNAKMAIDIHGRPGVAETFNIYADLCRRIELLDLKIGYRGIKRSSG